MIFYHGNVARPVLRKIRKVCPSLEHGFGYNVGRVFDRKNYFLDNGAFTEDFKPCEWEKSLDKVLGFENEPDFVVLPDVFNDPDKTFERSKKYVDLVSRRGLSYYYVAQKPGEAFDEVKKALKLGADGVFVGGDWNWKQRTTSKIVRIAHEAGLKVHIGMPIDFYWAYTTGADSMDSISVARHEDYSRMRRLETNINHQENIREWF